MVSLFRYFEFSSSRGLFLKKITNRAIATGEKIKVFLTLHPYNAEA
jgi:hypothetical protein